jgi:hypothetical protein
MKFGDRQGEREMFELVTVRALAWMTEENHENPESG